MEQDPGNGTRPSGCQVVNVEFRSPVPEEIGSITFRNHYTHSLTLKYCQTVVGRISNSKSDKNTTQWKTCIRNVVLMPNPHCERGSEKLVVLNKAHFNVPLLNVSCLRLILRQPSPDWIQFGIRDLKFYCVPSPFCQNQDVRTDCTFLSSREMECVLGNGLYTESEQDTRRSEYSVTILSYT